MRQHLSTINIVLLAAVMLLLGVAIGSETKGTQQSNVPEPAPSTPASAIYSASLIVPAVDDKGNGVTTDLTVEVKPGKGHILANIDQLLFITDTQQSIQTARDVAVGLTGADPRNVDIIYAVNTPNNVTVVGGPSAGAAFTIATTAALKHVRLRPDTAITGTISADGTIGQIGGVFEKAIAARERGITLFLVPMGQGTQMVTKPIENCSRELGFVYCEKTYNTTTINIGTEAGITVKEVADIREAAKLFGL